MTKLLVVAALGGALGFALTVNGDVAAACSCLGPQPWQLQLVETSAGVDRATWEATDIMLRRPTDTQYTLNVPQGYALEMEVAK